LTADLVDGLGMSGTEGVFRRCAEETLRVLRERTAVIDTVLQVFKHDPLHSWYEGLVLKEQVILIESPSRTANPFKLKRAQNLGSSDDPSAVTDRSDSFAEDNADRAIRGVLHKLDKSLSVEYTVNELITIATDEQNLSMIFGGECPITKCH
jgi:ataxia telangiectasia mutated family protein